MDDRELWLAATMVELADISEADIDETAYSRRLAARLAELLAPAEVAVLLADGDGRLRAVAASTERAHRLMSAEADQGDGAAAAHYRTGQPVPGESLAAARMRWPRFAAAARAAGFGIVFCLPLRRHDETAGVAGVLRAGQDPLSPAQASLAQSLAEAAAVAILRQRELRRSVRAVEQLQRALDSRVLVEQAKGAVAARLGITPEAAFELLRAFARRHSRPLAEVAAGTIGGGLTVSELVTVPQAGRSGGPAQPG
jgi:GAF domain-containing protein